MALWLMQRTSAIPILLSAPRRLWRGHVARGLLVRALDHHVRINQHAAIGGERHRVAAKRRDAPHVAGMVAFIVMGRAVEVAEETPMLRLVGQDAVAVAAPARQGQKTPLLVDQEEVA